MNENIAPGDLVIVVRTECGCVASMWTLGSIHRVISCEHAVTHCIDCMKNFSAADLCITFPGAKSGFLHTQLKKIPPLAELETCNEEIRDPVFSLVP